MWHINHGYTPQSAMVITAFQCCSIFASRSYTIHCSLVVVVVVAIVFAGCNVKGKNFIY